MFFKPSRLFRFCLRLYEAIAIFRIFPHLKTLSMLFGFLSLVCNFRKYWFLRAITSLFFLIFFINWLKIFPSILFLFVLFLSPINHFNGGSPSHNRFLFYLDMLGIASCVSAQKEDIIILFDFYMLFWLKIGTLNWAQIYYRILTIQFHFWGLHCYKLFSFVVYVCRSGIFWWPVLSRLLREICDQILIRTYRH